MERKHILICGKRNSGKTELFERLLAACRMPVYGFSTGIANTREDGYHEIYMFPAGHTDGPCTEENHLGDCNMRERTVHPEVFDRLGVKLLEARPDGIVAMDELGFMETGARAFCARVLELLDGDIPVLATAKAGGPEMDFLNRVHGHPKVMRCTVTQENREELYNQLLPVIETWNERLAR